MQILSASHFRELTLRRGAPREIVFILSRGKIHRIPTADIYVPASFLHARELRAHFRRLRYYNESADSATGRIAGRGCDIVANPSVYLSVVAAGFRNLRARLLKTRGNLPDFYAVRGEWITPGRTVLALDTAREVLHFIFIVMTRDARMSLVLAKWSFGSSERPGVLFFFQFTFSLATYLLFTLLWIYLI